MLCGNGPIKVYIPKYISIYLSISVMCLSRISADSFTSFGGIWSGPVAFEMLMDFIILLISSILALGNVKLFALGRVLGTVTYVHKSNVAKHTRVGSLHDWAKKKFTPGNCK